MVVVSSRRIVVGLLMATLLVVNVGCFTHPTAPTEKVKSPESVAVNVTPVTLGVAPAFPRVHDLIVFSWSTPIAGAQLDVCLDGRCQVAEMAVDKKSASFSPNEGGKYAAKLYNVVGADSFFQLATVSVIVN